MSLNELVVQKLSIDTLPKEQRDYSKISSDLFWNFLEDAEQIFIQRSKEHDFNIDSDEIAFLDFAVKLEDTADQMKHYADLSNLNFDSNFICNQNGFEES